MSSSRKFCWISTIGVCCASFEDFCSVGLLFRMSLPPKKDWIHETNRLSVVYLNGVEEFVDFAVAHNTENLTTCSCPCKKCRNGTRVKFSDLRIHLITNGVDPMYTVWYFHGEMASRHPVVENENIEEDIMDDGGLGSVLESADGSVLESAREAHAQVVEADKKITSSGTIDMDDIEHDALSEVFGLDKKCHTRGVSSYVSRKQNLHTDFVTSLHDKDVLASNANVDEKIGKMQSKIDSLEGMMKAVLEQVTLANMTTERANSSNATTPRTEVASSSVPRARIVPSNLMNSYAQVHQSGTPQRVSLLNRKKEVVASGVVDTENGGICHGREVDDGEVKVYIEKVFDGSTPVYDGPQNSCFTLEDMADGGYLIWLKARVRYVDG